MHVSDDADLPSGRISSLDLFPEFQSLLPNCLLDVSTEKSEKYLQLQMSEELLIFPSLNLLLPQMSPSQLQLHVFSSLGQNLGAALDFSSIAVPAPLHLTNLKIFWLCLPHHSYCFQTVMGIYRES